MTQFPFSFPPRWDIARTHTPHTPTYSSKNGLDPHPHPPHRPHFNGCCVQREREDDLTRKKERMVVRRRVCIALLSAEQETLFPFERRGGAKMFPFSPSISFGSHTKKEEEKCWCLLASAKKCSKTKEKNVV